MGFNQQYKVKVDGLRSLKHSFQLTEISANKEADQIVTK